MHIQNILETNGSVRVVVGLGIDYKPEKGAVFGMASDVCGK